MSFPKLDWTLKLSDVLIAISMGFAGVGLYTGLNQRVTTLEQLVIFQKQVDSNQDIRAAELKSDLLSALKEVHTSVDRLSDRIDRRITKEQK